MKLTIDGKIVLNGLECDNPLDREPYPKKDFREGKESARISFKSIWIDRYPVKDGRREYWSCELKILSNGKSFLDGKEIKTAEERGTVDEIFKNLKIGQT